MNRKKALLLAVGGALLICLCLALAYFLGGWQVQIRLRGEDSAVLSYGDSYRDEGAEAVFCGKFILKDGISIPVQYDDSGLSEERLGSYEVVYTADFLGFHSTRSRQVQVVDDTPPEITLEYIEDYYTRPIDVYKEEGFSAWDNYDGNLTVAVEHREENGIVSYTVSDSSGNVTMVQREIVHDDREPPVITLQGDNPLQVEKGEAVQDPGAIATDDCDGNLTDAIVTAQEDGQITYTVTDSYGNVGTCVRTVEYVDTLPPVVTLNGDGEMWMKAGEAFADPGCTAIDQGDGDITAQVSVSGTVERYHAGVYTLTYTAVDQAGNVGVASRVVHVEPRPQADVVNPGDKVVYLTFDDGPGPYTQRLLDVLAAYNVKATFFVTNANPSYRYLIGAAAEAGHTIGIHTYSHNYSTIYASEDAYFDDLNRMSEIVAAQTGSETKLIRFPGGSSNLVSRFNPGIMTALTQAVEDMGYQYFDWNVTSGDAGETTSTEVVAQNVISGIRQHSVSVVLQHDIKSFSVDAVEEIIAWGIENGYTFLPLDETSPTAHHKVNN
ncbi:MAG: polysaccharide deacetylase family protein [Clostridiales bacterium]|nr:polysaccharide deacetylase family protein [Clostridiales bacterium]